jgi:hypothetical protein
MKSCISSGSVMSVLSRSINSVVSWNHITVTTRASPIKSICQNDNHSNQLPMIQYQHRLFGSWPKIRPLRIRAITMDVTGTLVSFRGSLKQHYVKSAEKCGVTLPKTIQFDHAFRIAYKEISQCMYICSFLCLHSNR